MYVCTTQAGIFSKRGKLGFKKRAFVLVSAKQTGNESLTGIRGGLRQLSQGPVGQPIVQLIETANPEPLTLQQQDTAVAAVFVILLIGVIALRNKILKLFGFSDRGVKWPLPEADVSPYLGTKPPPASAPLPKGIARAQPERPHNVLLQSDRETLLQSILAAIVVSGDTSSANGVQRIRADVENLLSNGKQDLYTKIVSKGGGDDVGSWAWAINNGNKDDVASSQQSLGKAVARWEEVLCAVEQVARSLSVKRQILKNFSQENSVRFSSKDVKDMLTSQQHEIDIMTTTLLHAHAAVQLLIKHMHSSEALLAAVDNADKDLVGKRVQALQSPPTLPPIVTRSLDDVAEAATPIPPPLTEQKDETGGKSEVTKDADVAVSSSGADGDSSAYDVGRASGSDSTDNAKSSASYSDEEIESLRTELADAKAREDEVRKERSDLLKLLTSENNVVPIDAKEAKRQLRDMDGHLADVTDMVSQLDDQMKTIEDTINEYEKSVDSIDEDEGDESGDQAAVDGAESVEVSASKEAATKDVAVKEGVGKDEEVFAPAKFVDDLLDFFKGGTALQAASTSGEYGYKLHLAAKVKPHEDKIKKGGEDAFMINSTYGGSMAVADGVGGWNSEGIDPRQYPRDLCRNLQNSLSKQFQSADQALIQAHSLTKPPGSTTACVAVQTNRGKLSVANIGDAGALLCRKKSIVKKTKAMIHSYNCPYQLANPNHVPDADPPEAADVYSWNIIPGDIIILASDGLFDNLFDAEIESIIQTARKEATTPASKPNTPTTKAASTTPKTASGTTKLASTATKPAPPPPAPSTVQQDKQGQLLASRIASQLTEAAHIRAKDPEAKSPWAIAMDEEQYGSPILAGLAGVMNKATVGGKMDDCVVTVAVVGEERVSKTGGVGVNGKKKLPAKKK